MRHKNPAVVQHGSKATAPLGENVSYEGSSVLDEQALCEESGGIKMDNEEGIQGEATGIADDGFAKAEAIRKAELAKQARQANPATQYENISIAQAVMQSSDDMSGKVSYCNIEQVCAGQQNGVGDGLPLLIRQENEGIPIIAQNVVLGARPEDLSKGWFHGAVQNGKDVWLCVHCGGTFGEKGNLARHIRIVHDKVKEHVCSECGKAFGQKGDLVKHIKTIHEQERIFTCPVCNKAFSEKGNMTRHMRTVHKADDKLLGRKMKGEQVAVGVEQAVAVLEGGMGVVGVVGGLQGGLQGTLQVEDPSTMHADKKQCLSLSPAQPTMIAPTLISLAHPLPTG
mmetsp:Transcript_21961/g.60141  ORF Transcript_21961/g.60141 Transcript_21961/m.60141 type:complete len:340 (+) Transcript_21961:144-1163(+)